MSWFVVDVEADGPLPGRHSMVSFGAILVEPSLSQTFYGQTKPISDQFVPEALAVSGHSREQHLAFDDPAEVMARFRDWLAAHGPGSADLRLGQRGVRLAVDQFLLPQLPGPEPVRPLGSPDRHLYAGLVKDTFAGWKHLEKTPHTHDPVDDARGNAEAILAMKKMGLKIPSK